MHLPLLSAAFQEPLRLEVCKLNKRALSEEKRENEENEALQDRIMVSS